MNFLKQVFFLLWTITCNGFFMNHYKDFGIFLKKDQYLLEDYARFLNQTKPLMTVKEKPTHILNINKK